MHRRLLLVGALLLSASGLLILRSWKPGQSANMTVPEGSPVVSKAAVRPDPVSHCSHPGHAAHGPDEPCGAHPPGPVNPRKIELTAGFLDRIVKDSKVEFALPDGRNVISEGARVERDAKGVLRIWGKISAPEPGSFFLQRQDFPGVAGRMIGHVLFENSDNAWKIVPEGPGGAPILKEVSADAVVCMNLPDPEEMPQDHPDSSTVPNPPYQAVIPLQSLPGASGVIYPANDGKRVSVLADPDGAGLETTTLILTLPVRNGAVFNGPGDLVSDPVDGITYKIQGSTDLVDFTTSKISEVIPAMTTDLPTLSTGWTYRSFRMYASPTDRGFIRTVVGN